MSKSKKISRLSLLLLTSFALVACDDDVVRLPTNYESPIYNADGIDTPIYGNDYENYYNSLTSSDDVYKKTVNDILVAISKVGHGYGDSSLTNHDVSNVVNDTFELSVADSYDKIGEASDDNLRERAERTLANEAKSGSYEKDNLFYENKYLQHLRQDYFYLDIDMAKAPKTGKLLTSDMEYADIFTYDDAVYTKYMEKELYDTMRINYLTAEYIYTRSYASIGNSNARKVQVIGLTDRSDDPGAAKKLLNAYIRDYVMGDKKDDDFSVLSRLWKGITSSTASTIADSRYPSKVILTSEEEQWLRDNDILPSSSEFDSVASGTLTGKVLSDKRKLDSGKTDYNRLDTSLESTYTGSYAYDIDTGVRMAIDDIATSNLITEGIYLSSEGISNLPSDLSTRIFSPRITNNKNDIEAMKADSSVRRDITMYGKDGYRYLTTADSISGSADEIIYYDADSRTYYLTRILDVVDTASLSTTSTTSVYDTAEKREQIAREVAYAMSTTGSYQTNAAIYWLSRTKIDYSDEDFLEYMKTNYQDVFKSENPYTPTNDADWIVLN